MNNKIKSLFFFVVLILGAELNAQKVDSIKVEQAGDFIKIRYKILNSTPDQTFRVRVLCSINGGLNTELRSVSGDTGDNVPGGKSEYWVIWDVLKDVDELKSAEFIVRAELVGRSVSEMQRAEAKTKKASKGNFSIMGVLYVPGPGFGARISYMGRTGISAVVENGKAVIMPNRYDYFPNLRFTRICLDFTARLVNSNSFQMHLLAGAGLGQSLIDDSDYSGSFSFPIHYSPGLEAGTAFYIKRLALFVTGSRLLVELTEEGFPVSKRTYISFGAGLRF